MKGDFKEECNRTACNNKHADYYNHSTKKYYCGECARKINVGNFNDSMRLFGHVLCTKTIITEKEN